ncbi:MAG: DUF1343 domain-containing protein [Candidatus Riflebacteria bacterium]|nr:DUF1343 domain-containing protein [Candidatus Riflebacteria bacterium]
MSKFELGLEDFLRDRSLTGKAGLVTNNTGRDRNGVHLVERIAGCRELKFSLAKIFSPEHGFTSDAPDGEAVSDSQHSSTKIPIVSLYGQKKSPDPEDIKGLDFLVFDIQDVGVRFYTYISTLRNIIDTCAANRIPLLIADRPNFIGADVIEGPALQDGYNSFVGHLPVPLRYGMTCGELAQWWNNRLPEPAELKIYQCKNYYRESTFEDLDFPWFQPSPSMTSPETARFYPGTCLFEGTNLSEGRGTDKPFQKIGAPWIDSKSWVSELKPILPEDIEVSETTFVPTFSKFQGEKCHGIYLTSKSKKITNSVNITLRCFSTLMKTNRTNLVFEGRSNLHYPFIDYLAGNSWLRTSLENNAPVSEIENRLPENCEDFLKTRKNALLYK